MNLHRRDLTSSQKATVAVDVEKLLADEAKERQRAAGVERAKSAEREPKTGQVMKSQHVERVPHASEPAPKARDQAAKIVGTNPPPRPTPASSSSGKKPSATHAPSALMRWRSWARC